MAEETPTSDSTPTEQSTTQESTTTDKPHMAVKVYAPFKVYFEGDAYSVSAINATGPFDILPKHRNFLCMLVPCNLVVHPVEGEKKTIKIHRALMHVKADRVAVYVDV